MSKKETIIHTDKRGNLTGKTVVTTSGDGKTVTRDHYKAGYTGNDLVDVFEGKRYRHTGRTTSKKS